MNNAPSFLLSLPTARFRWLGVGLLMTSSLALLLAPWQMPASYSWLRHTTSESAAQGITGAWLARLGFMLFGLTVIWLSAGLLDKWPLSVRLLHGTFGVCMTAAAVFSSKPWLPNLSYDLVEDALHSFAATAMGFAFAAGVGLRLWHRAHNSRGRIADLVAIVAAVAIPLAMGALPDWDGLLQRCMFTIAYLWYGFELFSDMASFPKPAMSDSRGE